MTRETVAAQMVEAEAELQAAQHEHDGSCAAVMRYRLAVDRVRHLQWLAVMLMENE